MITALYAGLLSIMYVALTLYVVRARMKFQISLGDGRNDELNRRIRLHGNFIEYIPLILFLMLMIEITGASGFTLHLVGILALIGRVNHLAGLTLKKQGFFFRVSGMVMTLGAILIAALAGLSQYMGF